MKNVLILMAAVTCLGIGAGLYASAAGFESPLYGESPLFESPLPTSTSVFADMTIVPLLPTITPKSTPLGIDPPVDEPVVYDVLLFPVHGGD